MKLKKCIGNNRNTFFRRGMTSKKAAHRGSNNGKKNGHVDKFLEILIYLNRLIYNIIYLLSYTMTNFKKLPNGKKSHL